MLLVRDHTLRTTVVEQGKVRDFLEIMRAVEPGTKA